MVHKLGYFTSPSYKQSQADLGRLSRFDFQLSTYLAGVI